MGKLIDLTGHRFGRLVVVEQGEKTTHGDSAKWVCKCDCGNTTIVRGKSLRNGGTTSCGCYRTERTAEENKKRAKHGMSNERLYAIWRSMVSRCTNPKNSRYKDYGDRGISVCSEWKKDYLVFRGWALSNGYSDNLTIDRIDNGGNYCPENCRWATYKVQNYNRRNNHLITFCRETHTIEEWAKITHIKRGTLQSRFDRGWSAYQALTQYPRK